MEILVKDSRQSVKALLKQPLFTAIAIGTLALGIGANTAIFSVVNAVILRPLPYKDSDRIVEVRGELADGNGEETASLPDFFDWDAENQVFERMGLYRWQAFNLTSGDEPELLDGLYVSSGFFPVLGVTPVLGRSFEPDEDKSGGQRVVALSYRLWQRRFGGDPKLIGQSLVINGQFYTVVAVMPANFKFYSHVDLWMPVGLYAYDMMFRFARDANVIARLKPNAALAQAKTDMSTIAGRLEQQYPKSNTGVRVNVVSMHENLVKDTRPALFLLLGAVGFILLLACANVTNLMLARAQARRREMAIRVALGASRLRIIRQLLTESLMLAGMGGGLGLMLALGGMHFLIAVLPKDTPRIEEISIDGRVLVFTLFASILTAVLVGLAPALHASKVDITLALKEGTRTATRGKGASRVRAILAVAEVALALGLLIGAGLMIKSFTRMRRTEMGFNPRNVLTMKLSLPITNYPAHARRIAFYQQVLRRVQALPGVEAAATALPDVLSAEGWETPVVLDGGPAGLVEEGSIGYSLISHDYFRALGIPFVQGRDFTEQDVEGSPPVAIIDERLQRRLFGSDTNPLGRRIRAENLGPTNGVVWVTIVGEVRPVKAYGIDSNSRIEMYVPYMQAPLLKATLLVRTAANPMSLADAVRHEVLQVDSGQPANYVRTLEEGADDEVAPQRLNALLFGIFGGVALLLAAAGVYAVIAYSVSQRTNEMGIRITLGAQGKDVLFLVMRQGMSLALAGVAIGLALSFALTRVMSSMLYEIRATDPSIFITIPIGLALVALFACYVPGRRATKIDPIAALRDE